jgi:broad specificity phosphatase PhoE
MTGRVTEVAFIRHGRTEWNKTGRMTGRSDISLAPEGREEVAARILPTIFANAKWHTSPLNRTRETAALLGHEDALVEPCLIEMDFGDFEGRTLESLRSDPAIDMAAMEDMGLDFLSPGGESPRMVRRRLQPFFDKLVKEGGLHIAVAHKSVIRAVMADAFGWDMMGRPPVKLRWEQIHLFTLDDAAQPQARQMNIPFLQNTESEAV